MLLRGSVVKRIDPNHYDMSRLRSAASMALWPGHRRKARPELCAPTMFRLTLKKKFRLSATEIPTIRRDDNVNLNQPLPSSCKIRDILG